MSETPQTGDQIDSQHRERQRDEHGRDGEVLDEVRVHAADEHVVAPHDQAQKRDDEKRVDRQSIPERWSPGEGRDDIEGDAERR